MNDEEINRAIAEHLGWRCQSHVPEQNKAGAIMCWIPPGKHEWHPVQIPNYCGDLNAMHEAEKTLDGTRMAMAYTGELREIINPGGPVGDFRLVSATSYQRAEAFLRVVGKWRGEE
jgi:hypothetical protein